MAFFLDLMPFGTRKRRERGTDSSALVPRFACVSPFSASFSESENFICSVLKELDIKCVEANREPWYFFGEKFAGGGPEKAARELLPQPLEKRLNQFLRLVRQGPPWPRTNHHFHQWLSNYFGGNREAIAFFEMILVGETNARGNQVTTHYGLDCLYSCFCEDWFRIRGGSKRLVDKLLEGSKARRKLGSTVTKVEPGANGVGIHWRKGAKKCGDVFDAVIITAPGGEKLLPGNDSQIYVSKEPQYHGYISLLFQFRSSPLVPSHPNLKLENGLYVDGPINFIQKVAPQGTGAFVLRILIPQPRKKLHWDDKKLVAFCLRELKGIGITGGQLCASSVKKWESGLPYGGSKGKGFASPAPGVFLAGDRFGKWPSMNAALWSGKCAAKEVMKICGVEIS